MPAAPGVTALQWKATGPCDRDHKIITPGLTIAAFTPECNFSPQYRVFAGQIMQQPEELERDVRALAEILIGRYGERAMSYASHQALKAQHLRNIA